MDIFKTPILIYISKEKCPACNKFKSEWDIIRNALKDKVHCINFHIDPERNQMIPKVLTKPYIYYPTVILAGPKSYYRCYTPDDKINVYGWNENYTIKGIRFGVVEQNGIYEWSGRYPTAKTILDWFEKVSPQIPLIDESEFPPGYNLQK